MCISRRREESLSLGSCFVRPEGLGHAGTENISDRVPNGFSDWYDRGLRRCLHQEISEGYPTYPDNGCRGGRFVLDRYGRLHIYANLFYEQRKHTMVFCDWGGSWNRCVSAVWAGFWERVVEMYKKKK